MKTGLKLNLKFKILILLPVALPLLLATSYLLPTPALADTQIYPIPPATTPYGDGAAEITNAGWTNTHLLGQSFVVPAGINKITKIRLTNFKLGAGAVSGGGSNKGGIVSVALFKGEPTVFNQVWNRGLGGNESTNVIVPSGARIVKKEKVYIGDNEVPNQFNELCGYGGTSYPDNNIVTYLLKRMKIDPNNPCPKKSELVRMWNLFNAKGWTDLTNEWINGRDYPCGEGGNDTCSIEGWLNPTDLPDSYGGSDFLWPDFVNKSDVGAGATYFEGPGWTTQSASWQGTDSADNYIDVTLPDNIVTPGQTYFLSIQQSHTNPNNDPDRSDVLTKWTYDEYYESGQWNCENPNEAINADEPGYITVPRYMDGWDFCDGGNVFVAKISRNNPYPSGRTYINSDKWAGDSNTDVTNLTIWGVPPPPAGYVRDSATNDGISSVEVTIQRGDGTSQTVNTESNGSFRLENFIFANEAYAVRISSIPTPYISPPKTTTSGWTWNSWTELDTPLGSASYGAQTLGVNDCAGPDIDGNVGRCNFVLDKAATTTLPTAPTCNNPTDVATLSPITDPSNLTFTWGTVANGTSYSFKLDYVNAVGNWQNLVNKTGITPTSGATSYTVANDASGDPIIQPGYMLNFRWQVWASNAGGDGPTRTCSFTLPRPSLSLLSPSPSTAGGAVDAGPAFTSGLRSDDPNLSAGTTGQNYKNATNFLLQLFNAGPYNTYLQGIALAGSNPLTNYGFGALYDLTRSANATNGIVVIYNPSDTDTTEWYYDPTWWAPPSPGPTWEFKKKTYNVYYQGKWNVTNAPAGYIPGEPPYSTSALRVNMTTGGSTDINNPVFEVTFWKPLGSRTWGTYGYLKQNYYQAASDQYFSLNPNPPRGI